MSDGVLKQREPFLVSANVLHPLFFGSGSARLPPCIFFLFFLSLSLSVCFVLFCFCSEQVEEQKVPFFPASPLTILDISDGWREPLPVQVVLDLQYFI